MVKVGQVYRVHDRDIVKVIEVNPDPFGEFCSIEFLYIEKSTITRWKYNTRRWLEADFLEASKLLKYYDSPLFKTLNK